MLQQGVVRPSNSPWSSPIVMVRKRNGSWRFCIDFRKVNSVTYKDAYPLPRIDATLDSLSGSIYFSTLDLQSGYWQVELEESSKEKTAFSTAGGHYEFNVMPFGLTNAPATFQRLMECVLSGLNNTECLIYLDDIIVFSSSFAQHLQRLENVFIKLQHSGLRLNPSKCRLAHHEVDYLGFVVTASGIKPNPSKVEVVLNYPVPSNVKQLRHFLGMANYYRRFIPQYSKIAEPLHQLTRTSSQSFSWSSACQNAFHTLKQHLTSPPVLAYPCFSVPFIVATDASSEALGAVLSQVQNGKEVVIAYWSRQLTKAERNYSTIEREALAAVAAIKEFYPYLYGFPFTLITDHNPLTSLKGVRDVGGRIARWVLFLQQFNYNVQYKPGARHGNADALSRMAAHEPLVEKKINNISSLQELPHSIHMDMEQDKDDYLRMVKEAVKNGDPPPGLTRQKNKLLLDNGVLCRRFKERYDSPPRIQILVPSHLQRIVLEHLHDRSGHCGVLKTTEKIRERFYWPGYERDVENHIKACRSCQLRKSPNPKVQAPLGCIEAEYPFQKISWDITGPLPETEEGHKYILVVTDLFSKWVEAFPLKATDSETLATVLMDEIICRYGVPVSLHSDQGANLCSQIIDKLCATLGITRTRASAYHPQGNGQVERMNRTLKDMLAKMVEENQRNWDKMLQKAVFAYRVSINESTGFTPYLVNFGRSPQLPIDVMFGQQLSKETPTNVPEFVREVRKSIRVACDKIRRNLKKSRQIRREAQRVNTGDPINIGDRVYLFVPAVKSGRTKKLSSLWRGPYTVVDKTSPVNYLIQLVGGTSKSIVHRNRLKLCFENPDMDESHSDIGHIEDQIAGFTSAERDVVPRYPIRSRRPPERYGHFTTHK